MPFNDSLVFGQGTNCKLFQGVVESEWNTLPQDITKAASINCFKQRLCPAVLPIGAWHLSPSCRLLHRVSGLSLDILKREFWTHAGLPTVTEFQYFVKEMRPWVRKFFWILAQNTEIFGDFFMIFAWKYWNLGKCYWKSWNYSKLLLK